MAKLGKGAPPKAPETPKISSASTPMATNDRDEKKPQGRPRESTEARRHYHFQIEESIAERFDDLIDTYLEKTGGRKHGAAKRLLIHLIQTHPLNKEVKK